MKSPSDTNNNNNNNISLNISSTPFTSVISREDYSSKTIKELNLDKLRFYFIKSNTFSIAYPVSVFMELLPHKFASYQSKGNLLLTLPSFCNETNINDFLFITKNGLREYEDRPMLNIKYMLSLLKVSEYFENDNVSLNIINLLLKGGYKKCFNINEVVLGLELSLQKMKYNTYHKIQSDNLWFELFYFCLEKTGKNVVFFIDKYNILFKKYFDGDVNEEILLKCSQQLILGNYIIAHSDHAQSFASGTINYEDNEMIQNENLFFEIESKPKLHSDINTYVNKELLNSNDEGSCVASGNAPKKAIPNFITIHNLDKFISICYDVYNVNNFFELLTLQTQCLYSTDAVTAMQMHSVPTLLVKLHSITIPNNYYEEYNVDISVNNNKQIICVIVYKESEDSLNVYLKLCGENNDDNSCFKIFSMFTIVELLLPNKITPTQSVAAQCLQLRKETLTYLTNSKNMNLIYTINNYKTNIKQPYLGMKIHFKLCYLHSVLVSYFLQNFEVISKDTQVKRVSKELLFLVIKKKYINNKNHDDIIKALSLWLEDKLNLKEDITDIVNVVQWQYVSKPLLLEFVVKYSLLISKEVLHEIIKEIVNDLQYSEVIKMLFDIAVVKINYPYLLYQSSQYDVKQYMSYINVLKLKNQEMNYSRNNNNTNNNNNNKHFRINLGDDNDDLHLLSSCNNNNNGDTSDEVKHVKYKLTLDNNTLNNNNHANTPTHVKRKSKHNINTLTKMSNHSLLHKQHSLHSHSTLNESKSFQKKEVFIRKVLQRRQTVVGDNNTTTCIRSVSVGKEKGRCGTNPKSRNVTPNWKLNENYFHKTKSMLIPNKQMINQTLNTTTSSIHRKTTKKISTITPITIAKTKVNHYSTTQIKTNSKVKIKAKLSSKPKTRNYYTSSNNNNITTNTKSNSQFTHTNSSNWFTLTKMNSFSVKKLPTKPRNAASSKRLYTQSTKMFFKTHSTKY